MKVTKDGFKDRQLHIEGYLQMVSAEQKEYAEVSAHQRIAENNDIITDFQTDGQSNGTDFTQLKNRRIPNGTYGSVGGR